MGLFRERTALGAPAAGGLTAVLAAACALLTGAAWAQVVELGPQGVVVHNGPAVITPDGARSLVPELQGAAPPKLSDQARERHRAAEPLFRQAGDSYELSPRLVEAVAYVESRFNHSAVSPKGAVGLMQLMPATASELGVDPAIPAENTQGGAAYLRRMLVLFDGDLQKALAAYNAGPAAVQRYRGVPPFAETKAYVAAVMDYLAETSVAEDER